MLDLGIVPLVTVDNDSDKATVLKTGLLEIGVAVPYGLIVAGAFNIPHMSATAPMVTVR